MTNVLTWAPAGAAAAIGSRRLAALQSSHHAMWNYVTYRDAIALVGQDPDELYPEGTTRLPADWADLGWLTCFHGPPASALEAMRAALVPDALDVYPPDLIEPLRDEAARALGRRARRRLRGHRHRGRPGRPVAGAAGRHRSRRRGHPRRSRLLPPARRGPGGRRRPGHGADRPRQRLSPGPRRRGGGDHAAHAGDLPRRPQQPLRHRGRPRRGPGPDRAGRAPRAAARPRRDPRAARHRPRRAARGRAGGRARRGDLLGLALLRDGRRAPGLPGRAAGPHARLPAAQGGAHAAEHEPGLPARRAGRAARRAPTATAPRRRSAPTSPTSSRRWPGSTGSTSP